jgi:predicted dehydrogenase
VTSTHLAAKHGIPYSTTEYGGILADPQVAGVILCTRHHLHAGQVIAALRAGKHVLVEKPLCLTREELAGVAAAVGTATMTVGYNRRFSPHVRQVKSLLADRVAPVAVVATINAGVIPPNHWVHDPQVGGGRLVGEGCHFVDLAVHLTGSLVTAVCAVALGARGAPAGDSASILLRHADGSTSSINYLANGHRSHPKERIEIYSQERILVIDDFRQTIGVGYRGFAKLKTAQDKGHAAQFAAFVQRVREGGPALISRAELLNVAAATLAIGDSLRSRAWVEVSTES